MFIPIRTDAPLKRPPIMNYALIVLNMAAFLLSMLDSGLVLEWEQRLSLNSTLPQWYQFFSYQFLHADIWHLIFNMWFLWAFGNSLNSKLGNVPHLLIFLAGGAFAGFGHAYYSDGQLIGASGSVAAVTTAFMVFFPRNRLLILLCVFLIIPLELSALWGVIIQIAIAEVLLPAFSPGGNVSHLAHLFGYIFGFVSSMGLLLFGLITRDQFDLLAVVKRWNQRREFAGAVRDPNNRAKAQYGTVARPVAVDPAKRRELQARLDQAADLRARVSEALASTPPKRDAVDHYEQLMVLDPDQCLSRHQQMEVARLMYKIGKYPQAAGAFEKYVQRYPKGPEQDQVRLLLGIIYARDLQQYEAAQGHLTKAMELLGDEKRREQCRQWLERVARALSPHTPDTPTA